MQINETVIVNFPIKNDPHKSEMNLRLLTPVENLEIGAKYVTHKIQVGHIGGGGGEVDIKRGLLDAERMKVAVVEIIKFRGTDGKPLESTPENIGLCVDRIDGFVAVAKGFYDELEEAKEKADKALEKNGETGPDGSENSATSAKDAE